jgi:hypothetical protein
MNRARVFTGVEQLRTYLEQAELCAATGCRLCRRHADEMRRELERAEATKTSSVEWPR